jgi:hypothetical protein
MHPKAQLNHYSLETSLTLDICFIILNYSCYIVQAHFTALKKRKTMKIPLHP